MSKRVHRRLQDSVRRAQEAETNNSHRAEGRSKGYSPQVPHDGLGERTGGHPLSCLKRADFQAKVLLLPILGAELL